MVKRFKTFLKLQLRMLSQTKSRFISIFIITLIGSAFFSGLRMSPIIMNATTDAYLDQQKYADLTLIPTYGVTDEDIKEIAKIDGVEAVEGIYFFDVQVEMNKDYDGMVVYSLSNQFNLPYIVEGRNIKDENECLIDYQYKLSRNLQLNDTLEVYNDNGSKKLTIVGFVKDVRQILYYKRGQNTYGNGTTQGFIIMHLIF